MIQKIGFEKLTELIQTEWIALKSKSFEVDTETGKEKWVQEKFSTANLEFRKELFMKQPVFNLMGPVTFFLNGKGISTTNTKDSIPEAQK